MLREVRVVLTGPVRDEVPVRFSMPARLARRRCRTARMTRMNFSPPRTISIYLLEGESIAAAAVTRGVVGPQAAQAPEPASRRQVRVYPASARPSNATIAVTVERAVRRPNPIR